MPKATAVFDADDSRLSGALARINGRTLALQSRIAMESGVIEFQQNDPHTVKLSLPLEINDFVKLYFR